MSKKYLSLDEAARLLSIPTDELVRLRERGDIRGFADRGTWKFRQEDVETLQRQRQADSDPEVPLFVEDEDDEAVVMIDDSEHDADLIAEAALESDSDSDVKLVGDEQLKDFDFDSDSDVKLVGLDRSIADLGEGTDPEIPILAPDSDSDVHLVRPDSDSDVKLPTDDSDSDVKLVGGQDMPTDDELVLSVDDDEPHSEQTDDDLALFLMEDADQKSSDSDVRIAPPSSAVGDVTLIGMNEPMPVEDDEDVELDPESSIALSSGSSALLSEESGINLEGPSDSGIALDDDDDEGITLAAEDDSGISLDSGDSGISLESVGESGISLEEPVRGSGTIPMMNISELEDDVPETQFEIPALQEEEDSNYELQMGEDETGVLDIEGEGDSAFDLGDDETAAFETDDLEFEEDAFEAEDELNVFDADEEAFEDVGGDQEFAAPATGRMAMVEQEWGTLTFALLTISCLSLMLCGAVMIDLVKNTATSAQANPVSGAILNALGGIYK